MPNKTDGLELEFADPLDTIQPKPDDCRAERKLWLAVLEQAYRDATGRYESFQHPEQIEMDRANARAWFASNATGPGSLRWILLHTDLGVTVAKMRRRVLAT